MLFLHKELTNEWQGHRLSIQIIIRELKTNIQDALGLEEKQEPIKDRLLHGPRRYCHNCSQKKK